jgi:hypothetical protein
MQKQPEDLETATYIEIISRLSVSCPQHPGSDNKRLQHNRSPQSTRQPNATVSPHSSQNRTEKQQHRRSSSPVPLRISLEAHKQARIRKEVAVNRRQHHAREAVVLQHTRGDSLAGGLERNESDRCANVDVERRFLACGRAERYHTCGGDD